MIMWGGGVELNQKHIIKGMTCGMGLHLVKMVNKYT